MSDALIREIAEQIARQQLYAQWPLWLGMLCIALVVGFGASYIGSYGKKRGENLATKADFDDLLAQLRATTTLTEEVRSEVARADWATRELKVLRRTKLEELLQAVHEVQAWHDSENAIRLYGSTDAPKASPVPQVERLAGLYFPELSAEITAFCQLHRQMAIRTLQAHSEIVVAGSNTAEARAARARFQADWMPLYGSQLKNVSEVESSARELMNVQIGA